MTFVKKWWVLLVVFGPALMLAGCEGGAPPPAPFAPFAPSDLTATPVSSSEIDLAWTDNSTNESGFYVYRRASSYSRIANLSANTTSYSDKDLTPETTYWYKVAAYNDAGESELSNEASAKTFPPEEPPCAGVQILDWGWTEEYVGVGGIKWLTVVLGRVRNNTSQTLTVKVAAKFCGYYGCDGIRKYDVLKNVIAGAIRDFDMYHDGQRIERVEVWLDDCY